jgi:hypothetical protein
VSTNIWSKSIRGIRQVPFLLYLLICELVNCCCGVFWKENLYTIWNHKVYAKALHYNRRCTVQFLLEDHNMFSCPSGSNFLTYIACFGCHLSVLIYRVFWLELKPWLGRTSCKLVLLIQLFLTVHFNLQQDSTLAFYKELCCVKKDRML